MRVLVIGASGYVASRAVPVLLTAGHTVIAGARSPEKLDAWWWAEQVEACRLDVTDDDSVTGAFAAAAPEAVVYLVHGMGGKDFRAVDLASAQRVRAASDACGVSRIVYLSGIIPAVTEEELSEHLLSRLEVERALAQAAASVITLRAAMIVGAGSTSLALLRQLAGRLPVTVVPNWMRSLVEPIAVTDVSAAIAAALTVESPTRHIDIGGGQVMPYPQLIDLLCEVEGIRRPQLPAGPLPEPLVAKAAALLTDLPGPTVEALIESLAEDMVTPGEGWRDVLFGADCGYRTVAPREALRRALAPVDEQQPPAARDPLAAQPADSC